MLVSDNSVHNNLKNLEFVRSMYFTIIKHILKIGIWNLGTMTQKIKINIAIHEMKRMKIEIMGEKEIMWHGSGDIDKEGRKIFYSCPVEGRFEHGVVSTSKYVERIK